MEYSIHEKIRDGMIIEYQRMEQPIAHLIHSYNNPIGYHIKSYYR